MKKRIVFAFFLLMLIPVIGTLMYYVYNKKTNVNVALVQNQLNVVYKKEKNQVNNASLDGSTDKSKLANLDSYVGDHQFSGTVSVVRNDVMSLQKSYGQKDTQNVNTNTSAYRVNIQPILNRAIAYHLINEGKINIDSKLNRYFPMLKHTDKYSIRDLLENNMHITIKKIPTNTSGKSTLTYIEKNGRISSKSGTNSQTINTFLLSEVIFQATGSGYNDYVQNVVLNKFNVLDIGLMDGTPFLQNYANNFDYIVKGQVLQYTVPFSSTIRYVLGADNLYSTNADTLKILMGIFNGKYLKKSQVDNLIGHSNLGIYQKKDNIMYVTQKNGCSIMFVLNSKKENAQLVVSNVNAPKSILRGIIKQINGK